jgi:hypothetical protein
VERLIWDAFQALDGAHKRLVHLGPDTMGSLSVQFLVTASLCWHDD